MSPGEGGPGGKRFMGDADHCFSLKVAISESAIKNVFCNRTQLMMPCICGKAHHCCNYTAEPGTPLTKHS